MRPRLDAQPSVSTRKARLQGLDVEVIDLAKRTEALAVREKRLWGRLCDIESAVSAAMPPRPARPAMRVQVSATDTVVDGAHTVAVTVPADWAAEHCAITAVHDGAVAAYERQQREIGASLGLPLADKLALRASARLRRWGLRLAGLAPRTYAGLAAKSAVVRAIDEGGELHNTWQHALAISVSADAIRLVEAYADERDESGLNTTGVCTVEEAAEIDFEPWTGECLVPPNSDWPKLGEIHLLSARMAWLQNCKSKEELMELLARMDESGETTVATYLGDMQETTNFFRYFYDLMNIAELRIMVALSTMSSDPRYRHRFKDIEVQPETTDAKVA